MNEMDKLQELLEKNNIPYELGVTGGAKQVCYPNGRNKLIDAICYRVGDIGTYGSEKGLLEAFGIVADPDLKDEYYTEGWLTAKDVFNRIKKHYEKNKENK